MPDYLQLLSTIQLTATVHVANVTLMQSDSVQIEWTITDQDGYVVFNKIETPTNLSHVTILSVVNVPLLLSDSVSIQVSAGNDLSTATVLKDVAVVDSVQHLTMHVHDAVAKGHANNISLSYYASGNATASVAYGDGSQDSKSLNGIALDRCKKSLI